ncbi:hypothetical protein D915_002363 [Fasciola hepatica]|uniref:Runt domain-containing protein n=1 Tax=Fasciola hepatica TaxID=6192 RepID=A0A4E0S357_FASHE|nr:hypothetical protein D915_002363 [Fasciola hepatica]
MSDILLAEYTLKRALREHTMDLIQTSSPQLFCTPLPKHWRSNKSLPNQFRVVSLITIPDGTRVSVTAGNEDRPFAELKNPITVMHGNEARFSDLRFLGRSGRGKSFNITITVETSPPLVAVYARAIKVTVDGPRVPRNKYASPRTIKMMKEHRRMNSRHTNSFDQTRFSRGSSGRSLSYQTSSIRNSAKRNPTMNASKEAFSNFKDKLNNRIPFLPSAFGVNTLPKGTSNTSRTSQSPMDTSEALPLSILSNGLPVGEKSPSSSDNSIPSFGTKPDTAVPFSPFESTYLLSSINEAYARLLSRQLQPQQTPTIQHLNPSSVPTTRTIPSINSHSGIAMGSLPCRQEEESSIAHRKSYNGRPNKDNGMKIDDAVQAGPVLPRPIPPTLPGALFPQPRPMNSLLGDFLSQSSMKTHPDHIQVNPLNGSRPGHSYGSERRTTSTNPVHPLVPPTSMFPFPSHNSSPIGLNQQAPGPHPGSMGSAIFNPMFNPYGSNFYSILGAIFASWAQRGVDRKAVSSHPDYSSFLPSVFDRHNGSFASKSEMNGFTEEMNPVDLVARNSGRPKFPSRRPNTAESTESNDSILSIEKLLEVSSSQNKEPISTEPRGMFSGTTGVAPLNPFRLPLVPFGVPELTFLSNAFSKQLKDKSFRT